MSFDNKAFPILRPKAHIAYELGYDKLLYKSAREIYDAIESGKAVLFRSEHAKEVHDFSGIFNSIEVNKERVEHALDLYETRTRTIERLTGQSYDPALHGSYHAFILSQSDSDALLARLKHDIPEASFILASAGYDHEHPHRAIRRHYTERELVRLFQDVHRSPSPYADVLAAYCARWGYATEQVLAGLSFSPWEKLKGKVASMHKDPHIAGRYHVILQGSSAVRGTSRYTIQDGVIETSSDIKKVTRRDMNKTIARELIQVYEDALRKTHLEHQTPVMECILDGKVVTPVQLHMSRELELVEPFEIPEQVKSADSGWSRAQFIQGVTPVRGVGIRLKETKNRWNNGTFEYGGFLPQHELDTSFQDENGHYVCLYVPQKGGVETAVDTHGPVNQAFMPRISLTMQPDAVPESVGAHAAKELQVRIISNGREAYVRFDSPQA